MMEKKKKGMGVTEQTLNGALTDKYEKTDKIGDTCHLIGGLNLC